MPASLLHEYNQPKQNTLQNHLNLIYRTCLYSIPKKYTKLDYSCSVILGVQLPNAFLTIYNCSSSCSTYFSGNLSNSYN